MFKILSGTIDEKLKRTFIFERAEIFCGTNVTFQWKKQIIQMFFTLRKKKQYEKKSAVLKIKIPKG